jgi:hypothetical protein
MKFVHPIHHLPPVKTEHPKGPGPGGDIHKHHPTPPGLLPDFGGHSTKTEKPGERTDWGPGPGPGGDIHKHHPTPPGLLPDFGDHSVKTEKPHVGTDDRISSWQEWNDAHRPADLWKD